MISAGKDKKRFDEQLQELRTKQHDKLRYRLRKQSDDDAKRRLDDYLKHAFRGDDEDFGTER